VKQICASSWLNTEIKSNNGVLIFRVSFGIRYKTLNKRRTGISATKLSEFDLENDILPLGWIQQGCQKGNKTSHYSGAMKWTI